jgi:hypothetical protein
MKDEIERLRAAFKAKPILCVDGQGGGERAVLVTSDVATAKYLLCAQRPVVALGMPVTLHKFQRLVANEGITSSSFTTHQLATIAGQDYAVIHSWFEAGILVPDGDNSTKKERRSSFSTAFACGVAGALRRQGLSLAALRRAADLIRIIGKPEAAGVTA